MDTTTTTDKKRRTLGAISVSKFSKMPEWKQFETAAAAFTDAKAKLTSSKDKFREVLRKHSQALGEVQNLEFLVTPSKDEIIVYEMLKTAAKKQGKRTELEFA
jgi:hypothetical protein